MMIMGIFLYSLVLTRNEKLHVAKAQDLFGVRAFVCKNCYILGAQILEDLKSFFRHGKLQKNTLCLLLAYHFFYYKSFYDTYPPFIYSPTTMYYDNFLVLAQLCAICFIFMFCNFFWNIYLKECYVFAAVMGMRIHALFANI